MPLYELPPQARRTFDDCGLRSYFSDHGVEFPIVRVVYNLKLRFRMTNDVDTFALAPGDFVPIAHGILHTQLRGVNAEDGDDDDDDDDIKITIGAVEPVSSSSSKNDASASRKRKSHVVINGRHLSNHKSVVFSRSNQRRAIPHTLTYAYRRKGQKRYGTPAESVDITLHSNGVCVMATESPVDVSTKHLAHFVGYINRVCDGLGRVGGGDSDDGNNQDNGDASHVASVSVVSQTTVYIRCVGRLHFYNAKLDTLVRAKYEHDTATQNHAASSSSSSSVVGAAAAAAAPVVDLLADDDEISGALHFLDTTFASADRFGRVTSPLGTSSASSSASIGPDETDDAVATADGDGGAGVSADNERQHKRSRLESNVMLTFNERLCAAAAGAGAWVSPRQLTSTLTLRPCGDFVLAVRGDDAHFCAACDYFVKTWLHPLYVECFSSSVVSTSAAMCGGGAGGALPSKTTTTTAAAAAAKAPSPYARLWVQRGPVDAETITRYNIGVAQYQFETRLDPSKRMIVPAHITCRGEVIPIGPSAASDSSSSSSSSAASDLYALIYTCQSAAAPSGRNLIDTWDLVQHYVDPDGVSAPFDSRGQMLTMRMERWVTREYVIESAPMRVRREYEAMMTNMTPDDFPCLPSNFIPVTLHPNGRVVLPNDYVSCRNNKFILMQSDGTLLTSWNQIAAYITQPYFSAANEAAGLPSQTKAQVSLSTWGPHHYTLTDPLEHDRIYPFSVPIADAPLALVRVCEDHSMPSSLCYLPPTQRMTISFRCRLMYTYQRAAHLLTTKPADVLRATLHPDGYVELPLDDLDGDSFLDKWMHCDPCRVVFQRPSSSVVLTLNDVFAYMSTPASAPSTPTHEPALRPPPQQQRRRIFDAPTWFAMCVQRHLNAATRATAHHLPHDVLYTGFVAQLHQQHQHHQHQQQQNSSLPDAAASSGAFLHASASMLMLPTASPTYQSIASPHASPSIKACSPGGSGGSNRSSGSNNAGPADPWLLPLSVLERQRQATPCRDAVESRRLHHVVRSPTTLPSAANASAGSIDGVNETAAAAAATSADDSVANICSRASTGFHRTTNLMQRFAALENDATNGAGDSAAAAAAATSTVTTPASTMSLHQLSEIAATLGRTPDTTSIDDPLRHLFPTIKRHSSRRRK